MVGDAEDRLYLDQMKLRLDQEDRRIAEDLRSWATKWDDLVVGPFDPTAIPLAEIWKILEGGE